MTEKFISRGFKGRAREGGETRKERVPPGQYVTEGFPVLSAGPTSHRAPPHGDADQLEEYR